MSYNSIIERVFLARYRPGDTLVEFIREDLVDAATALGVPVPRNLGDVLYTFRYRRPLPKAILETAPNEKEWSIRGAGPAAYAFRLVAVNRVVPNPALTTIKIPDATPEVVSAHACPMSKRSDSSRITNATWGKTHSRRTKSLSA